MIYFDDLPLDKDILVWESLLIRKKPLQLMFRRSF